MPITARVLSRRRNGVHVASFCTPTFTIRAETGGRASQLSNSSADLSFPANSHFGILRRRLARPLTPIFNASFYFLLKCCLVFSGLLRRRKTFIFCFCSGPRDLRPIVFFAGTE